MRNEGRISTFVVSFCRKLISFQLKATPLKAEAKASCFVPKIAEQGPFAVCGVWVTLLF